jgi:hypothetical protein
VATSASDNADIAAVQFLLDGVPLEPDDTTAPYAISWDSTTVTDGPRQLAARARDVAGNVGSSPPVNVTVANGASAPPTPTRFEETAATPAPAEAWWEVTNWNAGVKLSGDRAVYSVTNGARATFTFTGTGVSWLGVQCEICGIAHVNLDGASVGTVDTFAPDRRGSFLFRASGLAAGTHTLVIEVAGVANVSSGGISVVVDAFDVTP